jgi:hypothetical protein
VPGLPVAWTIDGVDYDTLTLACGHVFNPSALALHFLISDMRCPACRAGPVVRLDADSLPTPSLRECFRDKAANVCARHEADDHTLSIEQLIDTTDLNIDRLEQDLTFTIEISLFGAGAMRSNMLQTRITPFLSHTSGEFVHYVTQQSFQRLFSRQVARHRENESARVRFHVQHPLFAQSISTATYPLAELAAAMPIREFVLPFAFGDAFVGRDPVLATLVFSPPARHAPGGATDLTHPNNTQELDNTREPGNNQQLGNTQQPAHATLLLHRQGVLALCVAAVQHAIVSSLRHAQGVLETHDVHDVQNLENLENLENMQNLQNLGNLENMQNLQNLQDLQNLQNLQNIHNIQHQQNMQNINLMVHTPIID